MAARLAACAFCFDVLALCEPAPVGWGACAACAKAGHPYPTHGPVAHPARPSIVLKRITFTTTSALFIDCSLQTFRQRLRAGTFACRHLGIDRTDRLHFSTRSQERGIVNRKRKIASRSWRSTALGKEESRMATLDLEGSE